LLRVVDRVYLVQENRDMSHSFGSRLAEVRVRAGLNQTQVATQVGIFRQNLGRYEQDRVVPSLEVAHRLAKSLGVAIDDLRVEAMPPVLRDVNLSGSSFGERLKKARLARGLSAREVAEQVQADGRDIRRYESDERIPSVTMAFRLADAVGVPLGLLLGEAIETANSE
jgi:transcriptional regulator with XRE-family HTH domain